MLLPDDDDDDASWELLTHPQETLLSANGIVSEGNEVVAQMRLKFLTSAGSSTDYPVLQAWLLEATRKKKKDLHERLHQCRQSF